MCFNVLDKLQEEGGVNLAILRESTWNLGVLYHV